MYFCLNITSPNIVIKSGTFNIFPKKYNFNDKIFSDLFSQNLGEILSKIMNISNKLLS